MASKGNSSLLTAVIDTLIPGGGTPLYTSLQESVYLFSNDNNKKLILLATDGIESCREDLSVCELADSICAAGIDLEVFSLLMDHPSNRKAFGLYRCIADVCSTLPTKINNNAELGKVENDIPLTPYFLKVGMEDLKKGEFRGHNAKDLLLKRLF